MPRVLALADAEPQRVRIIHSQIHRRKLLPLRLWKKPGLPSKPGEKTLFVDFGATFFPSSEIQSFLSRPVRLYGRCYPALMSSVTSSQSRVNRPGDPGSKTRLRQDRDRNCEASLSP